MTINELHFAEEPCLEWLREVGWAHVHGEALAPTPSGERTRQSEVILLGELRDAIDRLNTDVPAEARRAGLSS